MGDERGEPSRNHAALRLAGLAGLSLALVLCSAVATQITAAHFGFDPALGSDWGWGVYPPGQWIVWSLRHHDSDPVFFAQLHIGMLSATGVLMVVTIIGIGIGIATRSARPYAAAHGSAVEGFSSNVSPRWPGRTHAAVCHAE